MAEDRLTQEQSIKDRKKQLYDVDAPAVVEGSSRPFRDFLRDTPAAPLAGGVKAMLWAVGVVVVLLLAAALFKGLGGPKRPTKAAWTPMMNAHCLA
jgi:hypothetical protein